jgi:hypothetical protein
MSEAHVTAHPAITTTPAMRSSLTLSLNHAGFPAHRRFEVLMRRFLVVAVAAVAAGAATVQLLAAAFADQASAASVRSNTQNGLPYNLYFADIDGDGRAELLQASANKIFAFAADYQGTPILHKYLDLNVKRLFVGRFATSGWEHERDDVCAVLTDNSLRCYAISSDGTTLNWWFTQGSFIADDEQAIVGDYDGNGNDDVLVYKPSTGAVRLYEWGVGAASYFRPMPNVDIANLAGRINWTFYVGEFGQGSNRADLLLVNPANGQVQRYDSATNPSTGKHEFWWAFTTTTGVVRSNEDVAVARIENGIHDGVVLRDRTSGAIRFKKAEWASGGVLAPVSGLSAAGLAHRGTGHLAFAKQAIWGSEPGGTVRDDALYFDASGLMYRYDARWDGTNYTYWWAYQKARPALNSGWSGVASEKWTVVLCHIKGQAAPLGRTASWWTSMFDPNTAGGLGAYYWEMSYGSLNIGNPNVYGPYQTADTLAQMQALGGDTRGVAWGECKTAAQNAGKSVPGRMLAYINAGLYGGFPGGLTVTDTLPPGYLPALSTSGLSHEMAHERERDC